VKHPHNDNSVTFVDVWDNVGESRDYQLARAFDASRPSHAGMPGEHSDVPSNFEDSVDRGGAVVATYMCLDQVQIATSGARPL
jgi:hypothetical protein